MVLTPVIPAVSEVEARRLLEPRSSRPAWKIWQNPVSTKNTTTTTTTTTNNNNNKAGRGDVCPVTATQEAEVGGDLSPGREGCSQPRFASLHSSLGDRVRHRLEKTKSKNNCINHYRREMARHSGSHL